MKVIIVDDSSVMRRMIESQLADYPITIVGHAANGAAAVKLVEQLRPDIVTLDITMPEMDGLTCLDKIRKVSPDTKVIIITALSDKLTGLMALEKGARGYLFKPVEEHDLKNEFDQLIMEFKNE